MSGGKHCYPDSDVLINKYNIRDKALLERLEIQKVTTKLLGLDIRPERVKATFDTKHLITIHKYLFDGIYEWAGEFRNENLYKSEKVLSGGSAEYADHHDIERKLKALLKKYQNKNWIEETDMTEKVSEFLLELWSFHPFREGNTRTCITFLWHYLRAKNIDFRVELLRNNPMYVRDSLVMANYDVKKYLQKIISDALIDSFNDEEYKKYKEQSKEQYQISKSDYDAFKEKYSIKQE